MISRSKSRYNALVVLGPTASGKTRLAVELAYHLDGEIISVDSRQVYRGLDIGAGKDYDQYEIRGRKIPYHLIDVIDPMQQFYLQDFIRLSVSAFQQMQLRGKLPVFCGGTGLYLDTLHKTFPLIRYPVSEELRAKLSALNKDELLERLRHYPEEYTAHVDRSSSRRIIRAIEIAEYRVSHPGPVMKFSHEIIFRPYYLGIRISREELNAGIKKRLAERLRAGLVEETQKLIQSGIDHEWLDQLGLEYRYVSRFIRGIYSKAEMEQRLLTAIIQFAKRQMTWFRKMEREGIAIHWIDPACDTMKLAEELRLLLAGPDQE
jgi:tRNA dimethylallyltransferase